MSHKQNELHAEQQREGREEMTMLKMNNVDLNGTSLQGYFPDNTSYYDLVAVFGGINADGDDSKTDANWEGTIGGKVFCIYNYKTGFNYMGKDGLPIELITDWHIGGNDKQTALDLVKYFEAHKPKVSRKGIKTQRTYKDFEDFLQDKFWEENPTVLDDDSSDAYDEWLVGLDVDTLISYANSYGLSKQAETVENAVKIVRGAK